jgi:hypothetical protein
MPEARHKHLLEDYQEVKRWYDNLARGSIITANERLLAPGTVFEILRIGMGAELAIIFTSKGKRKRGRQEVSYEDGQMAVYAQCH